MGRVAATNKPSSHRNAALLALAVAALISATPAFAKSESVPPWVADAAHQTIPTFPAETRAVVLLDETTYTVAPNGTATEHRRHVLKILRPNGRDEATIVVPFDNDTKIRSLKVWSIDPAGHEYALKDQEMMDYGYPGQGSLFVDNKVRVAKAPGRDPGGIVAYEYEQAVRPLLTEKTWFFQEGIPRLNQSFLLELPPGFTYGTVWAHHPQAAPIDLEHQRFRWEMKDVPAIDLERVPVAPAEDSLAGRMTIHYAGPGLPAPTTGTWPSIGLWYQQLSKDRLVPTPGDRRQGPRAHRRQDRLLPADRSHRRVRPAPDPLLRHRGRHRRLPAPPRRRHLPQSLRRLQG